MKNSKNLITEDYIGQLQAEHRNHATWGASGAKAAGNVIVEILEKHGYIDTVLDFGAGKQELGKYVQEELKRPIKWTDYDPGIPGLDTLPEGQFGLVVTTDVLEHIEPEKVDEVLKFLADKTKTILVSYISCMLTGFYFSGGPFDGQDLHLSVHEPIWWKEKFDELGLHLFIYEDRLKFGHGRHKRSCFLVHERA